MSSGTYHRRWASAGAGDSGGSKTTTAQQHQQQNRTITSGIEPRTYGTSWNSVRWNKLLDRSGAGAGDGGTGHWSRYMSALESTSKGSYGTNTSSYSRSPTRRFGSQSAARNCIEMRNSGPSVLERSARFGGSVLSLMRDTTPNRTAASSRPLWLSDTAASRRSTAYNNFARNPRENAFAADNKRTPSSSSSARPFESGVVRHAAFASATAATASTSLRDRPYLTNTQQTVSSNYVSPTLRAERPWRQRMADAARLRNAHGDEIGGVIHSTLAMARARRSSVSSQRNGTGNSGDELQSSLNALKTYMDDRTTGLFRRNGRRLSSRESSSFIVDKSSRDSSVIPSYWYTPIPGTYSSQWNTPTRHREYTSRSYSPVRPRPNVYNATLSRYTSLSTDLLPRPPRSPWRSSSNSLYDNVKIHMPSSQMLLNSPIPESSREQESSRRLLSSKERTLRRHRSRQRSQEVSAATDSDSSSGTEQRAKSREKRLRKRFRKRSDDKPKSADKMPSTMIAKEETMKNKKGSEIRDARQGQQWQQQRQQPQGTQIQNNSEPSPLMATSALRSADVPAESMRVITIQSDQEDKPKLSENTENAGEDEEPKTDNHHNNVAAATTTTTAPAAVVADENVTATNTITKEKDKPRKGLFSFIKKKKTNAEKNENKTAQPKAISDSNNSKKETKKAAVEKKKGNKEPECPIVASDEKQKMLWIDVQMANEEGGKGGERLNPDQLAPHFVSPTSRPSSSASSSHRIKTVTAPGTSADEDLSQASSEQHYGAVARFNPSGRVKSSKSKSPAPVPGTWSGPEHHEMNISQNKHLQRHETCSNAKVMAIITKKCIVCTVPPLTVCVPEPKLPKHRKSDEIALCCAFCAPSNSASNERICFTMNCPRLIEMDFKIQQPTNVVAKFAASFASRTRSVLGTRKNIKAKRFDSRKCSVTVKEPSIRMIAMHRSLSKNAAEQNSCRAQVTVLTSPVVGVNFYRCRRRLRATHPNRRSVPIPKNSVTAAKAVDSAPLKNNLENQQEQEKKDDVSEEVDGNTSQQLVSWKVGSTNEELSEHDELILPDRSLLEEYVKRKREKMERLHSEPLELGVAPGSRESPCLSTASEFMQACAVHVLEPTRQVPYITAPSRSRLGSVEVDTVQTPTPKTSGAAVAMAAGTSKMLDLLSYGEQMLSASYHGLKSSPVSRSERSTSLTKPTFEFDDPMSPFEQRLQNQAFQLRKTSVYSEGDEPIVQDTPTVDVTMQLPARKPIKRPSAEGTSITTTFTAAVAAAAQPRHERYAAHIPLNRGDGSGRQSAASIESNNSGALETATRQLDQMIDQARYRHHQHRSKFKEAIDYLDQIFEDLKKEGDQTSEDTQRPCPAPVPPVRKGNMNSGGGMEQQSKSMVPQVKLRSHNSAKRAVMNGGPRQAPLAASTSNRHSLNITKPKLAEQYYQQSKPASFEHTSGDVDVVETVVLPALAPPPPSSSDRKLKGERLDFTRRWLAGDIKSWASAQPKSDLIFGGLEEEPDLDERSLGSCSAEVAAINAVVRKKKKARDMPDLIQNVAPTDKYVRRPVAHQMDTSMRNGGSGHYVQQQQQQQQQHLGPIKPQPVKPQAMYPFPSSSTGNLSNFSNFPQPFRDDKAWVNSYDGANGNHQQYPLQRVSSHSRVPEKKQNGVDTLSPWRSTSQDPYNTLSSVHSAELQLLNRKTGAFTPVQPPNIVTMRGSVASLPDSAVIRPQPLHSVDPTLAIDALVAELELNTETTVANKRRSFPTGIEFSVRLPGDYEQPMSSRQLVQSSIQQTPARVKSERNTRRHQQQQARKPKASFDEMTSMLQIVTGDIVTATNETPKSSRKQEQVPAQSGSVLSPFETINQEKLNPSKVEALQSMFENKQRAPVWRRSAPINNSNSNVQSVPASGITDDDNYYEINDFGTFRKELSPPTYTKAAAAAAVGKRSSPSDHHSTVQQQQRYSAAAAPAPPQVPPAPTSQPHEFVPAFPVTQPPSHPPGSTNSSQTGGYYSSGSSLGAPSSYASHNTANNNNNSNNNNHSTLPRSPGRGSLIGKQSGSSRAASLEDEDDGFYDNIQIDEKRFSRVSEPDSVSMGSHRLPPAVASKPSGNRLGQFLRKISASKPPVNAASLVSLNKVASEIIPTGPVPLMKSNSLSHDPWKKTIVQKADTTLPRAAVTDKRGGLGQRLKNSIFGSKRA